MTKYLLIFALTALAGCGTGSNPETTIGSTPTQSTLADKHNPRNSLDYTGSYTGLLPCADCEGIETQITLNKEGTYTKKMTYLGKGGDNVFEEKGNYTWNAAGQIITLEGKEVPNQYFVGENKLTHLDIQGQKIEGDLAGMYVLKKSGTKPKS